MARLAVVVLLVTISSVMCQPLDSTDKETLHYSSPVVESSAPTHSLKRRFINPMFALGSNSDDGYRKMRMKRSVDDDCEKLKLCKLHAGSSRSFIAAFELYFVNKENARLWDHRAHSMADCERRFGGCYYRK